MLLLIAVLLVVLKIAGVIHWPWLAVLIPAAVLFLIWFVVIGFAVLIAWASR